VRSPTIIDVATRAGVSKSLVSMVLRGEPGVSETRRSAVLAAADELGYRPNRAAAILAGHRTHTIGVVVDDFRNPWYVPLLDGIRSVLAPQGLRMTVADDASNEHLGSDPLDDLVSLRVDGIVMAGEPRPGASVPGGTVAVMAGTRVGALPDADVVSADERRSGVLATEHLLGLGHAVIGHVSGPGGPAAAREAGYRSAMEAAGRTPIVVRGRSTSEQDGHDAATGLLAAHPEVTAVFAANDIMAMGVMAAAVGRGRGVPADLSVIGCDDSPLAASPLLRLSSVDTRSFDVGRAAAERVLTRIESGQGAERPSTLLEPRLSPRSTTRPVPIG
jgi:DNA-binding LacI/PurR family transcriptional regulator